MVIHLMAGLPGSGKTHYAKGLVALDQALGEKSVLLDDADSKEQLVGYDGFDHIYVTSPHFCNSKSTRGLAEIVMKEFYPQAEIRWMFFENDPVKCQKNVLYRNDGRKVEEFIKMLSKVYTIPEGYVPQTIWNP